MKNTTHTFRFLLITLLLCCFGVTKAQTNIDGIFYDLDSSTMTAEVTRPNSVIGTFSNYSGDVVIPETVSYWGDTYTVTRIGRDAFLNNFYSNKVTSVTIPSTVTSIGKNAFNDCDKLEAIVFNSEYPPALDEGALNGVGSDVIIQVPAEYADNYQESPWDDLNIAVEKDGVVYTYLMDGKTYDNAADRDGANVYYTRTFNNTKWQPWYVPFDLNYDDISADFAVASLNDMHQWDDNNDGVVDRSALEVIYLQAGDVIKANTPYVIRANNTGKYQFIVENATLCQAIETSLECSSITTIYTFHGTYTPLPGAELAAQNCYWMGGGELIVPNNTDLKANRWYLKVTPKDGSTLSYAPKRILIDDGSEDITGVDEVLDSDNATEWPVDVYNLSGRLVKKNAYDLNDLPKGVYLVRGKKVMK